MDSDAKLMRIAAKQGSVFSRAQAIAAGLSAKQVRARRESGLWVPLQRGIYVPASAQISWPQRVWAALLAGGPTAAASHRTAAYIWEFVDRFDVPEISVTSSTMRARPGILIHRSERTDAVTYRGFRVTGPYRTIIDLAGCVDDRTLERAIDAAHRRGLIDIDRALRALDDPLMRGRPGRARLIAMLRDRDPERPIDSPLESDFFGLLSRADLPLPTPQYPIETRTGLRYADYAYGEHLVAIELDSWQEHGSRRAFEADRVRANDIQVLGWRMLHITDRQMKRAPRDVEVTVASAIGLQEPRRRRKKV